MGRLELGPAREAKEMLERALALGLCGPSRSS